MSLPKETVQAIIDRSDGVCEAPGCKLVIQDGAHIEPKRMGGRQGAMKKAINDPRNIAALCRGHHDLIDLKRREMFPGERNYVLKVLKIKINWYEWEAELGK